VERHAVGVVRKGGLEPPRSCDRQPVKLANLLCWYELTRIHRTDVVQERAIAHARADFVRTNSHTRDRESLTVSERYCTDSF
jgi:hypothetical protein